MKKTIFLPLSIIMVVLLSLMLFACGDDESPVQGSESSSTTESEHFHSYDMSVWKTSKDGHYNPCTCHPSEIELKPHVDNLDWNGVCDVCQYVLKTPDLYTLTLIDNEGNPIEGAVFIFKSNDNVTVTTDKNGKASVSFTDVSGVNAVLESLPEGYTVGEDNKRSFPFSDFEQTITVYKK